METSEYSSTDPMDLNTPPATNTRASSPNRDPSPESMSISDVLMEASIESSIGTSKKSSRARRPHNERQKAQARATGPRLRNSTKTLGVSARIFAMSAYWDPTHQMFHVTVHLPAGEEPPDVDKLMMDALAKDKVKRARWRRRRLDRIPVQVQTVESEIEIEMIRNEASTI